MNLLDPNYGLDPLQMSMQQFAGQQQPQMPNMQPPTPSPQQAMNPGPTGDGIMSALQGKDPTAMMMLASSLLSASGPQRGNPGFGARLGGAVGQAVPQILNMQSIKARTEIEKQYREDQKHQFEMQQAARDEASARAKDMIGMLEKKLGADGSLSDEDNQTIAAAKYAMVAGDHSGLLKLLNPESAKAPSMYSMPLPNGKKQAFEWDGSGWKPFGEPGTPTPQTQVSINNQKPPTGYYYTDPNDPSKGVKPIPGGPAEKQALQDAARTAQYQGAADQIPGIQRLLFNEDGSINRGNLTTSRAMEGGIPGTPGQQLAAMYETGIQAITRGETGAAMPASEIDNARKRFQPGILDSDKTARIKWQMYQDMLNGTLKLIHKGRGGPEFDSGAFDAELKKRLAGGGSVNWNDLP